MFITGRKKDLIVLQNGKKVFPEEIEVLVNRLDEVSESFVYALPDKNDPSNVKVAVEVVYDEKIIKLLSEIKNNLIKNNEYID